MAEQVIKRKVTLDEVKETLAKHNMELEVPAKKEGDAPAAKEPVCPEGSTFDAEAGKCVPMAEKDPKTVGEPVNAKVMSGGDAFYANKNEVSSIEPTPCGCNQSHKMAETNIAKPEENKAVVQAAAAPSTPAAAQTASASPAPTVNIDLAPLIDQFKNHEQKTMDKLAELLGVIKPKTEAVPEPSSKVSDGEAQKRTEAYNAMKEWFLKTSTGINASPTHQWKVNKDELMLKYFGHDYSGSIPSTNEPTMRKVEAVTVSGGDMPQFFSNQIHRIPGGRIPLNVRPYVNYQALDTQDRANWYKIDGMNAQTYAEGTEPTAASQTVTKITATPGLRGVYQKIGYSQVENAPFDLVQAVQDQMALSLIDDEALDLLTTVYDAIAAPSNWVNANTGGVITADDAAGVTTFKREGLLAAKRLIQAQGHDVRPGNLVLFMHPKAYQELLLDTNINNYYQYASPDITARGVLEMLYGVDIVVSDHVAAKDNTTIDTFRNVMAVKGIWAGLASARDVTFEAQRRNELQQILITATQRVKSAIIDETSTCRISSGQA